MGTRYGEKGQGQYSYSVICDFSYCNCTSMDFVGVCKEDVICYNEEYSEMSTVRYVII